MSVFSSIKLSNLSKFFIEKKVKLKSKINIFLFLLLSFFASNAFAEDILKSANKDFNDTFGSGSSLVTWLYIAEVLMGTFLFLKTRNPLVLIGIIVVVFFTKVGFGMVGS